MKIYQVLVVFFFFYKNTAKFETLLVPSFLGENAYLSFCFVGGASKAAFTVFLVGL